MSNFQKHLDVIRSGKIERGNIIGIRKAFNAFERSRNGYRVSSTAPKMTVDEYSEAERIIPEFHPTAVGELHPGGLKVLRNKRYAKRWTPAQRRIIDGACRFDLIRFDFVTPHHCVPVWRVISRDCESFAFRNIPWQTAYYGGLDDGPCVVEDN